MTLAWLGANVIKVEPPAGDQSRAASSDEPGVDSHYFMLLNANKQSMTCNLKHEKGRELLRKLIAKSDVFVENFGPGVIERLGFSYEEVSTINPRIVYAQIKGFAPDGPYANYLSFDMIAQATGGAMSINGERDGRPLRSGVTVGDTGAGLHCVIGILSALYQRESTGRGQRVEVVMQEVVTNFARIAFASNAMFGEPAVRNGNASVIGSTAPSEAYPCKGGGPSRLLLHLQHASRQPALGAFAGIHRTQRPRDRSALLDAARPLPKPRRNRRSDFRVDAAAR